MVRRTRGGWLRRCLDRHLLVAALIAFLAAAVASALLWPRLGTSGTAEGSTTEAGGAATGTTPTPRGNAESPPTPGGHEGGALAAEPSTAEPSAVSSAARPPAGTAPAAASSPTSATPAGETGVPVPGSPPPEVDPAGSPPPQAQTPSPSARAASQGASQGPGSGAGLPFFGATLSRIGVEGGLAEAQRAGVGLLRKERISWKDVEPVRTEPPTYRWEVLGDLAQELQNASQAGLQVELIVMFTPDWAQAVAGHSCGPIAEDKYDEFAEFLRAVVARYSQPPYNVHLWELFNEPDVDPDLVGPHSVFGCWGDADDPQYGGARYAGMLRAAYPAIKDSDPKAQVILGGLLLDSPVKAPARFLAGVFEGGGGNSFDILAYHAYTYFSPVDYDWELKPGVPWSDRGGVALGKAAFLREVMARYGYDKPLLLNEAGFGWGGGGEPVSGFRRAQADYVAKLCARGMAIGLEGIVWYGWTAPGWRSMNLLKEDLSPTLGGQAYAFAASRLGGAAYVGPAGYEGISGYEFEGEGAVIQVVWSTDGQEQTVSLSAERAPQGFDSTGQEVSPVRTAGRVAFSVLHPLYLVLQP